MVSEVTAMALNKNNIDMINGPLWGKILKFAAFYMLTAVLQQLYSAADVIVVGRYAGETAFAGVGTCSVIVNLFFEFILGLSAGATIVLGQALGAKNNEQISKIAHTSIAIAIISGIASTFICFVFCDTLLGMIEVPEDVFPQAKNYLRVISFGFIPSLIYNFGASILRAKGDTKRALYIVSVSGLVNVLLNLLFVCVFKMQASGVALATVISQTFTAIAIMYILCHETDEIRINLKQIRVYKNVLFRILRFGLPSGIQGSVYSVSNALVQSSLNGFGAAAIAGGAAVSSITNFYNVMLNSFYQAAMVFVSQNSGAAKFDRIKKTIYICVTYVTFMWAIQGAITYFFGETLLTIYAPKDPEVVAWGLRKLRITGYTYGLLGFMNIMSGSLRGMGASFVNMVTSIIGVCGIRILWILTAFKAIGTFESLYLCYPVSWVGTMMLHIIMLVVVFRKSKAQACLQST